MIKTFVLSALAMLAAATAASAADKPTIVLVHGAFAEGSSWDGVAARLRADHYPVILAANQLRGVPGDSASLTALLSTVQGPVVLVGHSYGGVVISNAAKSGSNVRALVYVAGFAPETGESAATLSTSFPGSALGEAIMPAPMSATDIDLYIQAASFRGVFAADVPADKARVMAAGQRPVTQAALTGASGDPAWKMLPSWFVYGDADRCIPAAAHAFMAERAGSRRTVVIPGASHAVMVSHASEVADVIETAAGATAAAAEQ